MSARKVALLTLSAMEQKDAWANVELKKQLAKAGLDRRDAALATRLCFGTLQNRICLDYYLEKFSSSKLSKLEPYVRNNLRMALYQILFMERIPHSAAVNEGVHLTKKYAKNPRAAGMVNGILRAILRQLDQLPSLEQRDPLDTLALKSSHPRWLVDEFARQLEWDELEALLTLHNEVAPTSIQVNHGKIDGESLQKSLEAEGVTVTLHPFLQNCFLLEDSGNVEQLSAFQKGHFYVQDPAANMAILAAAPVAGERVLDACAAPGGKSFATAIAMGNCGELLACDLYPHKEGLMKAGAERLGLSCISTVVWDAQQRRPEWEDAFDLVLADVPCSGLGVIGKKPEIRYKDVQKMQELPDLQEAILQNISAYVKPGGRLLYATCTLRPEENEAVVKAFLEKNPQFTAEAFTLPGSLGKQETGMYTFWPQRCQTDGFFVAKLRRQA